MKTIKKMQMSLLSLLIVMSSLLAPLPAFAAGGDEIYVSASGDDLNNDGSESSPFATMGKALTEVDTAGTIVLLSDIALEGTLNLSATGKTVTIQSAPGHKYSIKRAESFTTADLMNISGGNITFDNLIIDGNNVAISAARYGIYVSGGTNLLLDRVEISNHIVTAGSSTAAVLMVYGSSTKVTIREGSLVRNNEVRGYLKDNPPSVMGAGTRGVLAIEGGLITENEVVADSNGVIIGIGLYQTPRFEMTGGNITGNKLLGTELDENDNTIGNVAVYMRGRADQARFDFGGTAYVYDNLNAQGNQRNVYLKNKADNGSYQAAYLTLTREMEAGAKVGVYAGIMPEEVTYPTIEIARGGSGYQASVTDAVYFSADINTTAAVKHVVDGSTPKIVLEYSMPIALQLDEPEAGQIVGTQPTVSGTGTPGVRVTVTLVNIANPSESIEEEVTIQGDGTWEFTPSTKLPSGDYTLRVTASDGTVSAGPEIRAITVVDKADLEAKVAEINGTLSAADYTPETWSALQDELSDALGTLVNGGATQADVDQALNDLIAKVAALRTPAPTTVTLFQSETDGNRIVLLFDQEVELTDLTDFTVTVDDDAITPSGWSIDPSDKKRLVLTLPSATDVGDKTVKVKYDGNGNLTSVDHVPVVDFEKTALDPFSSALRITTPSAATVSVPRPAIAGTAEAGSTVTVVIKDGAGYELSTVVTADADGRWSFTPSEELADGSYTIEATAAKGGQSFTVSKPLAVDTTERPGLSALQLNSWNGTPIGVSPVFDSGTYKYSASVANSVYGVTLESLALFPGSTIQVSVNGGTPQTVDSGTASDLLPLNVGANTIIVKVTDDKGNETEYEITVTRAGSGSSGGGSGSGGTPSQPEDKSGIQTSVNDKDEPFATGTVTDNGGRSTTAVQVDPDKLKEKLAQGSGQKLKIHSPNEGDVKVDGLTAADVKQIADKGASLEISNPLAIYPVPGGKMDLSGVSGQLGNAALGDIAVHIDIKRSPETLINNAQSQAASKGYELLVPPVDLDLTFTSGGKTVRSEQLNGYAPKYIALPEGIDPNRITTGVIVNPDGSVFHVPTVVTKIDSRYYALINDLRSSGSYSVIWNPQDFDDVRTHWGKADVNNIAARLSLAGNGDNTFSPDRNVTRSEFSEIVVVGLGLMRQSAPQNQFPDVPALAWYRNSVAIANEFDIVRGYNDGNFYGTRQITREQGFAMIARALRLINPQASLSEQRIGELLSKYEDAANVSAWAREDAAQLIAAGIVQGNGADTLKPKTNMTRAEVTALIARLLKTTELIDK